MQAMVDGEADILVCTTIIETGIDIPNVNTLIIEDADKMGLAQLHQIRGRMGRSARRAYAYLTYRRGKVLQEIAAKRLAAIREYVEFGSGFKIAMRDLEIRGAGNLLGPEQSGYLMSVGYDLYLKLLEEAVLEERGEEKQIETECAADLTVNAHIPDRYVPSPEQRMDLYRRIAAIRTRRGRLRPAGRDAGPLRRAAQVRCWLCWTWRCCALPRPRPGSPTSPRRGSALRLHAGSVPARGAGGGVRPAPSTSQRLTLAAGEIPAADPEAQARGRMCWRPPGTWWRT